MSLRARRYWDKDYHHIPPRHPALVTPKKIRVTRKDHEAWNRLFCNAGTQSQILEILRRDWGFDHYPA